MNQPKHPKNQLYLKNGLFDGLKRFEELEKRIKNLPTVQERGDAFEVFAEAYLATQKHIQPKRLWPFDSIPEKIKKKTGINTPKDMGVDGLYETSDESYIAYQVKYRGNRRKLRWGKELSTFMGMTEQVDNRVLFTNSVELPELMKDRINFWRILGTDLDRLERADFAAIEKWLHEEPVDVDYGKKPPKPHQKKAIEKITQAFENSDRTKAIMACGTGKTLIALWVAEKLAIKNIIVLLPSLALMRQTLHEWFAEIRLEPFSFLSVCSDPTVTKAKQEDEVMVLQSDLDFPVSTDPADVQTFLSRTMQGVRIVFTTYQSAKVVASGMPKGFIFDFGVFDEAHKTAGRTSILNSFALRDENLSIKKRLFLTATPRHYNVSARDKEGDLKTLFSMDVPEVYGEDSYTLAFSEAIRQNIICDYEVIISVVTLKMVNDFLDSHGEVLIEGVEVRARQVANQIALSDAVKRYNLNKIFTFHNSVNAAKSFVSEGPEGVGTHLPSGFELFHVNGVMKTATRDSYIGEFRKSKRGLVSNARCLTEGVDVPAVDMVAFMSPKKSKVDIVQATGRAMRKAPDTDKVKGYVLLPIYLEIEEGESIEEAVERGNYEEVWNVLEALKEHDDVLADIIEKAREARGRGYTDTGLGGKVTVLGPTVDLDVLREAIETQIITNLGDMWDERFGQLVHFKDEYSHCNVPQNWPENPQLGTWVSSQRTRKTRGTLSFKRIHRLESLGFIWNLEDAHFEEMFAALVKFNEDYGHCNVPQNWPENPQLGTWVSDQRKKYNRKKMSDEHIHRLEILGFIWNRFDARFEEMFEALVQFKEDHGHCNVLHKWVGNKKLANWINSLRVKYKGGKICDERIQRLNTLGLILSPYKESWEEMFAALVKFNEDYGHCNVPQHKAEFKELGSWVHVQRRAYINNKLSDEHIQRMQEQDFIWNPKEALWEENLAALVKFKAAYGHCYVPDNWVENTKLANWVAQQRTARRQGKISDERIERLEKLGFSWNALDARWEEMFEALIEYKKQHDDCNVPKNWPEKPKLSTWVYYQRASYKKSTLSKDRIQRLEALGFEWSRKTK